MRARLLFGALALMAMLMHVPTAGAMSREAWRPNPGPQERFLASTADEALYGGAAGGGKSAALVAAPLRWVGHGDFRALILRRETTQLGDLLDKAQRLYPVVVPGAAFNANSKTWRFPSGATIRFNHCKEERDAFDYQGQEFQFIGFDELTHFTEAQYQELQSRVRSPNPGLPRYIRATTNPGGSGHEWVMKRFGAWLNPDFVAQGLEPRFDAEGRKLPPAAPGQKLTYLPTSEGEVYVAPGTPKALTRTFIPARLSDNPRLTEADPNYQQRLMSMDPVRRAQLMEGNWLIKPAAGLYFKKAWFSLVDASPAHAMRVRYWDLAASPKGDWAAGVKLARSSDGVFWVEHVQRLRGTPGEVRATVQATAELDGTNVPIWIEQDPGQAGKDQVHTYATHHLVGWMVHPRPKRSDKVTAAGPVSSQAQALNIRIVRGPWNVAFLDELESFPDGDHDDQVDGLSGAFAALTADGEPAAWDPVRGRSRWS